jgi:hypothetical protein
VNHQDHQAPQSRDETGEQEFPTAFLMPWSPGWWFFATPLKNMLKSVGMIIPNIWKNKKCSKPPTSHNI